MFVWIVEGLTGYKMPHSRLGAENCFAKVPKGPTLPKKSKSTTKVKCEKGKPVADQQDDIADGS